MSRIGLGRHGSIEDDAGDPLDGLVNLFDIGMVLAVAFLIAGVGLTLAARGGKEEAPRARAGREHVISGAARAPTVAGRGEPVGRVYRLPDGRLVYVKRSRAER
ncbi:MAG TPA: DUF2149 domain-containing protein [Solirubrobacterales bacterium]|jgi:hypothetical protein